MQMLLRALFLVLLMTDLTPAADNAQLIIVDPGHFHAALIQKEMYGGSRPPGRRLRRPLLRISPNT